MKKWVDRKTIYTLWISYVVFVAIYISSAFWPFSSVLKRTILGVAYLLPPGAAMIGALLVFLRSRGKEGVFWGSLAAGLVALFSAEGYWGILQIFFGVDEPPAMSFATYAFLTGYAFLFIALFAFWRIALPKHKRLYGGLMTTFLMICTGLAVWFFQLQSIYAGYFTFSMFDKLINMVYPTLDVALLVGFLATAVFSNITSWPLWLSSVVVGIAMYAVGDIGFTYLSSADAYQPGTIIANVVDVFWMSCYVLIFNGALLQLGRNNGNKEGIDSGL